MWKLSLLGFMLLSFISYSSSSTSEEAFVHKFKVKHIKPGETGKIPKQGDYVTIHYHSVFAHNGKKFDSTHDRNSPFTFVLGEENVIKCFNELVSRMTRGERIQAICESDLAYGKQGHPGAVPPNTDIGFDIELIDFGSHPDDEL